MIKSFYEAFKDRSNAPALVLKTSGGAPSVMDRIEMINRINQIKASVESNILPNVYLAYGDFSEEEMNDLYNHPKVKVHVSFTKGEGFGRPLIEAALTSKPIITTNWSGHLDFLNSESSILLSGTLTKVHKSASWKGVLNEDAEWFTVDYKKASENIQPYLQDIEDLKSDLTPNEEKTTKK